MTEPYRHPVLWRNDKPSYTAGIFTKSEDPEEQVELHQHSTLGLMEMYGLDEFYRRLAVDREIREKLGVPPMTYCAYSFHAGYDPNHVMALIGKMRELGYEVRGWYSEESAMTVICAAVDDLTEDAGWDLYEWANIRGNAPSDSYGHASWYEFCLFGIPVYDTWTLMERDGRVIAVSPDEERVAFFGP